LKLKILNFFAVLLISMSLCFEIQASDTTMQTTNNQNVLQTLLEKINKSGSTRVIVLVNTESEFKPMATTSSPEAVKQINEINASQDRIINELSGYNVSNIYKFKYTPFLSLTVDEAALNLLANSQNVKSLHEDKLAAPILDVSIPLIGATNLHGLGTTGTGVTVAIIDTGVDKNHPFLTGSVVSEACYSSDVPSDSATSVCPGGVTESTAVGSALPYAGNCPPGECDHGTHVAGISSGRSSIAGSPGPGVAPGSNVIAVQVFSRFDNPAYCAPYNVCALAYDTDIIKGLERVYELRSTYNISSANISLGGGQYSSNCDSEPIKLIIDNLRASNIATIISSGNDDWCGYMGWPACVSTSISVGATNDSDSVASFSNSASFLSLFAPGVSINSSVPGTNYQSWNGTSMAAPHVTGAWALMRQQYPSATVSEILTAFQSTGPSITDSKCTSVTKKRINVFEAFNSLALPPVQPKTSLFPCDIDNNAVHEIVKIDENGNISFLVGLKTWYDLEGTAKEIYCGDINLDYKNDIVVMNNDGSIYYSLDAGNMWNKITTAINNNLSSPNLAGTLTWNLLAGNLNTINLADLNGNGVSDIYGLNSLGKIYATYNYKDWQNIPGTLNQVKAGNLNLSRSGNELAGLNSSGNIYYTQDLVSWINIPGNLTMITTGDINGDGKADIIGIGGNGMIYYTTNLITWQGINGELTYITTGDFNGDKINDIIGFHGCTNDVYYTTNLTTWTNIAGKVTSIITGDFNGDGKSDVAAVGTDGNIYVTTNLVTWTKVN